ncbi:MAG TPA: hypothetical protein VFU21_15240, partial [Kofleriaceae bacterium]|nr:hypothetical protein [Kofleriaceae bacterium]
MQRRERRAQAFLDRARRAARRNRLARVARRHAKPSQPCHQIGVHRARRPPSLHRLAPEHALSLVLVVRPTEDPDVLGGRAPTVRHRHHVVELEEPGLLAPPPVLADERALQAVARHHLPPHLARNGPAVRARPARPRRLRLAELPALDLVEQRIERPVQYVGQIARRHPVAQQGLRPQELSLGLRADRQLEREPLRRERRHARGAA